MIINPFHGIIILISGIATKYKINIIDKSQYKLLKLKSSSLKKL